jgi:hypothetical protein
MLSLFALVASYKKVVLSKLFRSVPDCEAKNEEESRHFLLVDDDDVANKMTHRTDYHIDDYR